MFTKTRIAMGAAALLLTVTQSVLAADEGEITDVDTNECAVGVSANAGVNGSFRIELYNPANGETSARDFTATAGQAFTAHFNIGEVGPPYALAVDITLFWRDGEDYVSIDHAQVINIPPDCEHVILETYFSPGDNRLNRQAYANVAVVCNEDESRVDLYRINGAIGTFAFSVSYEALAAATEAGVIASGAGIAFERTGGGTWLVNGGAGADGKGYLFEFDACPPNWSRVYVIENGVVIPTEANIYTG
jgi:hypothetical protein